jgi:hypothetical protein
MRPWCRRGDSNSHGLLHYALNVARLPFRHFGMKSDLVRMPGADPGTRTPDLLFTKQLLYQLS